MEYVIAYESSAGKLEEKVQFWISMNFVPLGGVSVSQTSFGYTIFAQALIKEEKPK